MLITLDLNSARCLESLILAGNVVGDDAALGTTNRLPPDEMDLFLLYVFGRRVMDATTGILVDAAIYDAREEVTLDLSEAYHACAQYLVGLMVSGKIDEVLIQKRDAAKSLATALGRPAAASEPTEGGEIGMASGTDRISATMTRPDARRALFAIRSVFQLCQTKRGTRLVGQQEVAPAYWTLFSALLSSERSGQFYVHVELAAGQWLLISCTSAFDLLHRTVHYAHDESAVVDLVHAVESSNLLYRVIPALRLPGER
jgi:hypothetical protein